MRAPAGILRPNREAIAQGLSFALPFQNGANPTWVARGRAPGAFVSGATRSMSRGGTGMMGTGGYWSVPFGTNTYTLPTVSGTVLFCAFSVTASGDATFPRRYMFAIGNGAAFPAQPWCGMSDFDNQIETGWVGGGVDGRIKVSSASGAAWRANTTLVMGLSWGSAGQIVYYNGVQAGSNAFNNFGSVANQIFAVGDAEILIPWARSAGDSVLYLLVFDRQLTAGEHRIAAANPWWWVETGAPVVGLPPLSATIAGEVPITAEITAILQPFGDVDTHDGLRRSRRLRRIETLRQRGEAERLADAQALRLSLEAALGLAAEVVPDTAPRVAEAVQRAPKPAEVDWRRVAEDAEQYARLSRLVARLSALVQAEAKRRADDDDDDAAFLLGVV